MALTEIEETHNREKLYLVGGNEMQMCSNQPYTRTASS